MNKTILIGVGAVAAFLLYRKFMAKPKVEEEVVEETEEQTEEGGGAPSGGGGGGGGSAPAPKPAEKPTTKKTMQVQTKGTRPSKPNIKIAKPRMMGVKPMRPIQGMSRPMAKPMVRPLPASKPMTKFAGFMDFDGFPDVQANIM